MQKPFEERLQEAFNALCEIAKKGGACPGATKAPLFHGALTALARRGLIYVEMTWGSAGTARGTKQFYRVTILKGPAAGMATARDARGFTPVQIIALTTRQRTKPAHPTDIMQRRLEARA